MPPGAAIAKAAFAFIAVVLGAYKVGVYLALNGTLGSKIQLTSTGQAVLGHGNVVLGARPEWGAAQDMYLDRDLRVMDQA